jgi:ketosteroid isomerase-like protein
VASIGRRFYDEQIAYLEAADVEGLINNHYHEDAVLIGFDVTIRGRAALIEYFHRYLAQLGSLALKSTDKYTETEDAIFFEATIATAHGEAKVYNAFVLKDRQITRHFSGLIAFTPLKQTESNDTTLRETLNNEYHCAAHRSGSQTTG